MLKSEFLLDDFVKTGTSREEFETLVKEIDEHTICLDRVLSNFVVLSLVPEKRACNPAALKELKAYYIPTSSPVTDGALQLCSIPLGDEQNRKIMETLIEETCFKNSTLLYDLVTNQVYYLADAAIKTLGHRIGVNKSALEQAGVCRDIFIASRMNKTDHTLMILKQYRQNAKVFALMGSDYTPLPLKSVVDLYKEYLFDERLGIMQCDGWTIDHRFTLIRFIFPELGNKLKEKYALPEKLTPGVEFMNSDTGESSFTVRRFWKTNTGGYAYEKDKVFRREHSGNFSLERVKSKLDEAVFSDLESIPAKIAELDKIQLSADFDPDRVREVNRNNTFLERLFKIILRKLSFVKIMGKKNEIRLLNKILFEVVNPELKYTAADVVMDLFNVQGLVPGFLEEFSRDTIIRIQEQFIEALDLDYQEIRRDADPGEEAA